MMTPIYDDVIQQVKHMTTSDQLKLLEEVAAIIRHQVESKPKRSLLELDGLGAEMWRQIDVDDYLDEERNSWDG